MKINHDKLTPFDLQVLNEMALAPNKFALSLTTMEHSYLGNFKATVLGMQVKASKGWADPNLRQLSWRGQILVGREHDKLLSAPIDPTVKQEPQKTNIGYNQTYTAGGIAGHSAQALSHAMAGVQQQTNAMKSHLQQSMLAQTNALRQQQAMVSGTVAPPSPEDTLFGYRVKDLINQHGLTARDIGELKKYAIGAGAPSADLLNKISWL